MSHTILFNITKSHFDNDGDLFPEFGSGIDSINKTIPADKKFSHYRLRKIEGTSPLSNCEVSSSPPVGKSGNQKWKISWGYPLFGRIRYSLQLYAAPSTLPLKPVRVNAQEEQWNEFAYQLVKQKRQFKIIARDELATYFWRKLTEVRSGSMAPHAIDGGAVLITLGIASALVLIIGLTVFGAIFIHAINNGYNVAGKFVSTEDGPALELDVKNQSNN